MLRDLFLSLQCLTKTTGSFMGDYVGCDFLSLDNSLRAHKVTSRTPQAPLTNVTEIATTLSLSTESQMEQQSSVPLRITSCLYQKGN